jgi:hypothetical protein
LKYFITQKLKITMKKLFIVLAIASLGFVACNNESKTEVKEDTTSTVAPAPVDTTAAPAPDTTAKPDSTKK